MNVACIMVDTMANTKMSGLAALCKTFVTPDNFFERTEYLTSQRYRMLNKLGVYNQLGV